MSNFDRLKPFTGGNYPEPWDVAGHAYATDRAIVARVPSDPAAPLTIVRPPAAHKLHEWDRFPLVAQVVALPEIPPVPAAVPCESCGPGSPCEWECPECEGSGYVYYSGDYAADVEIDCPVCRRSGAIGRETADRIGCPTTEADRAECDDCGGSRTQTAPEPPVEVCGVPFQPRHLRLVAALPGVVTAIFTDYLLFESGDLQGFVMTWRGGAR